ncbi:MAG: hypothetical protein UZ10_BCD003000374 [Bacteroidetes bacterium OLB10]|nr:MAG: hypothetical protein UZ10_BCD003000374 [Bacteroidetes bacterium OLB10]
MMSVSQFIILGGWLLQGNFSIRLRQAFSNKAVWILCSVYVLHLIGLIYSADYAYAFKDLRVKLPLLLLPVLFASSTPLTNRQLNILLTVFISATFISTFISYLIYLDVIHKPFGIFGIFLFSFLIFDYHYLYVSLSIQHCGC